jgi:hypothetical protein
MSHDRRHLRIRRISRIGPIGPIPGAPGRLPDCAESTAANSAPGLPEEEQTRCTFSERDRQGDIAIPIHDWSCVPAGLFHHFHQEWSIEIARALNRDRLPKGLSALVDRWDGSKERDVRQEIFASRANRIVVKQHLGRIIAVIEIVSPGSKESRTAIRNFVERTVDCLHKGIHVLVVDLFPPTLRDPYGIHKVIWDEIVEADFRFPDGKDRILVSYETSGERAAYIEPVAVGDVLPDMPLFLTNDLRDMVAVSPDVPLIQTDTLYVTVPLEPTYQTAWDASPEELRIAVETGVVPEPEAE